MGNSYSSSDAQSSAVQQTQSTTGAQSPTTNAGLMSHINNGGTQVSGNLTYTSTTTSDPVVMQSAFDLVKSLVTQANTTQADTQKLVIDSNGQNNNQLNSVLASVLSRDQGIAANTASGGSSGNQSFILWALGIALTAAVAIFTFGRKKTA